MIATTGAGLSPVRRLHRLAARVDGVGVTRTTGLFLFSEFLIER